MREAAKPVVLALSGHDPSAGAGLQADIEALGSTGCQCVSVITSLTTQNTARLTAIQPQPPEQFAAQLHLLTEDIRVDVCKIGLIGSVELAEVIADYLSTSGLPTVLDPIIYAGTGDKITGADLLQSIITNLLPHTAIITPNLREAFSLTGCDEAADALPALLKMGCDAALLTNADAVQKEVINTFMDSRASIVRYRWERLPGTYHGSGCTLSAAIAGYLARGDGIQSAVEQAQEYTWRTLSRARKIGRSQLHPERLFNLENEK